MSSDDHDIPDHHPWWPDGVPVRALNPPDCEDCYELCHALARTRRGRPATAAGDATLAAFADGGAR